MEQWKDVAGYESKYSISNFGRIKTKSRDVLKSDGTLLYRIKERLLNPSLLPVGYYYVGLHNKGKTKLVTIHSLVAKHFLNPVTNKRSVNHIDGNKTNNHISNLEWCSYSENNQHAYDTGLKRRYKLLAINKSNSTLNFESVNDAVKLGFTQQGISKSVKNNTYHNGYRFNYI